MKQIPFYSLIIFFGTLFSCTENKEPEPPIAPKHVMEYYVILKDSAGDDLLNNETIGHYDLIDIKVLSLSESDIDSISYAVSSEFSSENRLQASVYLNDNISNNAIISTVFNLQQVSGGILCEMPDVYTNDTIKCEISIEKDSIVCKNVWINNSSTWANESNKNEKPCFTLIKKWRLRMICGGIDDPD